jgi:hypothetical protein
VRTHGAPGALPTDADFSPTAPDLSMTYAKAWLMCRYLAETFGRTELGRFYGQVNSGATVDRASRSVFAVSTPRLVRGWHSYLESTAR